MTSNIEMMQENIIQLLPNLKELKRRSEDKDNVFPTLDTTERMTTTIEVLEKLSKKLAENIEYSHIQQGEITSH